MGKDNDPAYCCYCGKLIFEWEATVEHLVPKSGAGNNSIYNKRSCCPPCNTWRGSKPLLLWKEEISLLLFQRRTHPPFSRYELEIILENIDYWNAYIESAGNKLKRET